MSKCQEKHTMYQPTDEEWRCPICGSGNDYFIIDTCMGDDDCLLLHVKDTITCDSCAYTTTGSRFVSRLLKKKNQVSCPHCKGTGFIDGSKIKEESHVG